MIGNQLYKADENGVLSLIDTGKDTRWVLGNGNWYYLEDGVPVKIDFREIKGIKYYFDGTGKSKRDCSLSGVMLMEVWYRSIT